MLNKKNLNLKHFFKVHLVKYYVSEYCHYADFIEIIQNLCYYNVAKLYIISNKK
jgi:hypothetical protein